MIKKLRSNEMFKYDVIVSVINGKITKKAAKIKLRCSIRTIDRYIVKFKTLGIQGFIHGNRDRIPKNVISKEIKKLYLMNLKAINILLLLMWLIYAKSL